MIHCRKNSLALITQRPSIKTLFIITLSHLIQKSINVTYKRLIFIQFYGMGRVSSEFCLSNVTGIIDKLLI